MHLARCTCPLNTVLGQSEPPKLDCGKLLLLLMRERHASGPRYNKHDNMARCESSPRPHPRQRRVDATYFPDAPRGSRGTGSSLVACFISCVAREARDEWQNSGELSSPGARDVQTLPFGESALSINGFKAAETSPLKLRSTPNAS